MADDSATEWADATWDPVTGCTKVSPGCENCPAETYAERWRGLKGHPFEQGFNLRLWPERLEIPLDWAKPRLVVVNSMSDLFHEDVPDAFIDRVFETMMKASHHTFQVLTRRTERMAAFLDTRSEWRLGDRNAHIWLGTSVENEDYRYRAELLRTVSAGVRFLSCEPLLGPLDLADVLEDIDWVIVGGESGSGARPLEPSWVRDIRDQCVSTKTPFQFEQWSGNQELRHGRELDGRTWDEMPAGLSV